MLRIFFIFQGLIVDVALGYSCQYSGDDLDTPYSDDTLAQLYSDNTVPKQFLYSNRFTTSLNHYWGAKRILEPITLQVDSTTGPFLKAKCSGEVTIDETLSQDRDSLFAHNVLGNSVVFLPEVCSSDGAKINYGTAFRLRRYGCYNEYLTCPANGGKCSLKTIYGTQDADSPIQCSDMDSWEVRAIWIPETARQATALLT